MAPSLSRLLLVTRRALQDWVCRTALDVAEGLQHLHEAHHLVGRRRRLLALLHLLHLHLLQ